MRGSSLYPLLISPPPQIVGIDILHCIRGAGCAGRCPRRSVHAGGSSNVTCKIIPPHENAHILFIGRSDVFWLCMAGMMCSAYEGPGPFWDQGLLDHSCSKKPYLLPEDIANVGSRLLHAGSTRWGAGSNFCKIFSKNKRLYKLNQLNRPNQRFLRLLHIVFHRSGMSCDLFGQ